MRALLAAQHFELPPIDEAEAVAIVGFSNTEVSQKVVECLRERSAGIKILEVGTRGSRPAFRQTKRSVAWHDIMSDGMEQEIELLSLQQRVQELRDLLKDVPAIAILLQDDPDPDGLASALALRKVLGRNSQTAAIVSFGQITRPENVAMSRLLGIEVEKVDLERLHSYPKVVLVDCQPSFFKGRRIRADIVIDHHPKAPPPPVVEGEAPVVPAALDFEEIREDLGALSTLLTQYLRAATVEVSQRLATALLYGIKSDTLFLNRGVADADLDAFVYLYPLINGNVLRKIERPELPVAYLESLRTALKHLSVKEGIVVLPLKDVSREEWIPQAADFALQVEGAQWAFGCGIFEEKLIISGRNCGYVQHCGDLFKELFDGIGCAGGHRTMAKALIPKAEWLKRFGARSLTQGQVSRILTKLVSQRISAP